MGDDIAQWWSEGSLIDVVLDDGTSAHLFVHEAGQGPTVTLLHGYPSSSYDWASLSAALVPRHRVIAIDLLGFGRSSKPPSHHYAIGEQANLAEQIWRTLGITSTHVVAHDYSATLAQELLARDASHDLCVTLDSVTWMNGGLYPALHRPTDGQLLLRSPDGDAFAAAIGHDLFVGSIRGTMGSTEQPRDEALDAMWTALEKHDGHLLLARLLHYMDDRTTHGDRWIEALETTSIPLTFVWGPEDPVSGAHMVHHMRTRLPGATFVVLPGVGHWPMLEAPEESNRAVIEAIERATVPDPTSAGGPR